jgi:thiamine-phosphate pyrophosphorylase
VNFDSRLYLVAPARLEAGDLRSLIPELVDAGVDAIQLREKEMEAGDLIRVAEPIVERCRGAGVPFILNDRPDVALAVGADGVHVGQNDLPVQHVRAILPDAIVGVSTHAETEIDATTELAVDYFAVGPVFETPTKPGRPSVGMELVRYAAGRDGGPWFAIGGIDESNIENVLGAGARRVVVVRAITAASDPPRAAARLRKHLDSWE